MLDVKKIGALTPGPVAPERQAGSLAAGLNGGIAANAERQPYGAPGTFGARGYRLGGKRLSIPPDWYSRK